MIVAQNQPVPRIPAKSYHKETENCLYLTWAGIGKNSQTTTHSQSQLQTQSYVSINSNKAFSSEMLPK